MRRANAVLEKGTWSKDDSTASVTLPFDDRHRRRIRLTDDDGEAFMLDLPEATRFEDGDGLSVDGGGVIAVKAAEEPVVDISTSSAYEAARIAWHIGNRHTPMQVLENGKLRIREDHVLVDMVRGLGATVESLTAPFAPESGAYSSGGHSHDH